MSPRKYTYIRTIFYAWFDKGLYREVANKWEGIASPYLLILLTFTWIPIFFGSVIISIYIKHSENYPKFIEQIPHVIIKDGKMKLNKASPHHIKDDKGNKFLTFDINAKPKDIITMGTPVLFTKEQLVLILQNGPKVISLSKVGDWNFDGKSVDRFVTRVLYWLTMALTPILIVGSLMFRLAEALILAVFTWLFNLVMRTKLGFMACWRLSAVALTPAICLSCFEYLNFQFTLTYGWFVLLITLFYAGFAVYSNRKQQT